MKYFLWCAVIFLCGSLVHINAEEDYFKYSGQQLTLEQNGSFTQFYFLNGTQVFRVTNSDIPDKYFPKCCPPKYKYNAMVRKCVKSNETAVYDLLKFPVNLVKSGLKECDVIIDHVASLDETKGLIENGGILKYANETFPLGKYCIDSTVYEETQVILRLCYPSDYCSRKDALRCLKKCCDDGDMYIGNSCKPQPEYGFPTKYYAGYISKYTDHFALFTQKKSCRLHFPNISTEYARVTENGSLHLRGSSGWKTYSVQEEMYCFELGLKEPVVPYLLLCVDTSDKNNIKFIFSKVGLTISCCCFFLTMAVYVVLHKLEKTIHRIVFCYCLAELIGFTTLTYLQISPHQLDYCKSLAFVVLFGFLAGFAWLNVMCYDMWRTLGSMETKVGDRTMANLKKIIYYSLYAWSAPIIITVGCYFEHTYHLFPAYLHAHVGEFYCILEQRIKHGNYGHTLFFILPMTLVIIVDVIFFILTIRYITQAADSIRQLSDSSKKKRKKTLFALKKKTVMTLKLFLVMGINWSFEIISSIVDFGASSITKDIEILIDTFNCFQGVFVFSIFVLKWKMIKSVLMKLKVFIFSSVSRSTSTESTAN